MRFLAVSNPSTKSELLICRVEPGLRQYLKRAARKERVSVGELMRSVLWAHVKSATTPEELLKLRPPVEADHVVVEAAGGGRSTPEEVAATFKKVWGGTETPKPDELLLKHLRNS